MTSESIPEDGAPLASAVAPLKDREPPQPVHSVLDTCQTDSESVSAENPKTSGAVEIPEAPKPVESKHAPDLKDHPLGPSVAASEPEAPAAAQTATEHSKEALEAGPGAPESASEASNSVSEPPQPIEEASKPAVEKPQTGEKRDLDSIAAQATDQGQTAQPESAAEKVDEPQSKKQKTDQELAEVTNGAASAKPAPDSAAPVAAEGGQNQPKKEAPSKKEKIKEAAKKATPADGPGTRTRSRTKDT